MSDDSLEFFIQQRNAALLRLDVRWLADFLIASGNPPTDMEAVLVAAHKTRYNLPGLPEAARHESGKWLRAHGYSDLHGLPLLPEGTLPT